MEIPETNDFAEVLLAAGVVAGALYLWNRRGGNSSNGGNGGGQQTSDGGQQADGGVVESGLGGVQDLVEVLVDSQQPTDITGVGSGIGEIINTARRGVQDSFEGDLCRTGVNVDLSGGVLSDTYQGFMFIPRLIKVKAGW